jgi:GR25 family glycosyltransferase involved in LPS biosynthesis
MKIDSNIYLKLTRLPVHLSYLLAMYDSMKNGYHRVLILEDDIMFETTDLNEINHCINEFYNVSANKDAILFLGYCIGNCDKKKFKRIENTSLYLSNNSNQIHCKHAILHKTNYFKEFLNSHTILDKNSDWYFDSYYRKYNIERYVTKKPLINQNREIIKSKNENFNKLQICDF